MNSISLQEITVTFDGNFDILSIEQKKSLKKIFNYINGRIIHLDKDINLYYYGLASHNENKTFEVSGFKNQDEQKFLEGINELQSLNPRVSLSNFTYKTRPINVSMGVWSLTDLGLHP